MEFPIDSCANLIEHSNRLLAGIEEMQTTFTSPKSKLLQQRYHNEVLKYLSMGKSAKDIKDFSIKPDMIDNIGHFLRHPMGVICHYIEYKTQVLYFFQVCTRGLFTFGTDLFHPFIPKVLTLYNLFIRVYNAFKAIPDLNKIPLLYAYYFYQKTKEENHFCYSVYKLLSAPDTTLNSIKPISECLMRFILIHSKFITNAISADEDFKWKRLRIDKHPSVLSKKNKVIKPFYTVMMHLDLLCETSIYIASTNIIISPKFMKLIQRIYTYRGHYIKLLPPQLTSNVKTVEFLDKTEPIIQLLRDLLLVAQVNTAQLCEKMPLVLSTMGFAYYEVKTLLHYKANTQLPALIYYLTELALLLRKKQGQIQRFAVYNLASFDYQLTDYYSTIYTLTPFLQKRVQLIVDCLGSISLDAFDSGQFYDFSSLQDLIYKVILQLLLEKGNQSHIMPLMKALSMDYLHCLMYQDVSKAIDDCCPLKDLVLDLDLLKQISHDTKNVYSIGFLILVHFMSENHSFIAENPQLGKSIEAYYLATIKNINDRLFKLCNVLTKECFYESLKSRNTIDLQEKTNEVQAKIENLIKSAQEVGMINKCGNQSLLINDLDCFTPAFFMSLMEIKAMVTPHDIFLLYKAANKTFSFLGRMTGNTVHTIVIKGLSLLTYVQVKDTDEGIQISRKFGSMLSIAASFYQNLIKEALPNTFFSNTLKSFIDDGNIIEYTSQAAFKYFFKVFGVNGSTALNAVFLDEIERLCIEFTSLLMPEVTCEDSKMPWLANPMHYHLSVPFLKDLIQISCVLRLRLNFLESIGVNDVLYPSFDFLEYHTQPHKDKTLMQMLQGNPIRGVFTAPFFVEFVSALMWSPLLEGIEYDTEHDCFTNNVNLLSYFFDAMFGVELFSSQHYKVEEGYSKLFKRVAQNLYLRNSVPVEGKENEYLEIVESFLNNSDYLQQTMLPDELPYEILQMSTALIHRNHYFRKIRKPGVY